MLRIDDLDTDRNVKGSADLILKTLETFGLYWDGDVYYQSRHLAFYEQFINELQVNKLVYPCTCSRKDLANNAGSQISSDIYSGICRAQPASLDKPHALRIKTDSRVIVFRDGLQGSVAHELAAQHGDFVVKRKDNIFAYQFAVVIDDHLQHVNQVVRGFDLLEATPKQIYLQQLLGFAIPAYMHVPVIIDGKGYKLSKQTQAAAVDVTAPCRIIFDLLMLLKQNPPSELKQARLTELLNWAVAHWKPALLKDTQVISYDI